MRKRSSAEQLLVYIKVDGLHLKAGVALENAAVLMVFGVDVDGRKHLMALEEGYREPRESWLEVLRNLRDQGMQAPVLASVIATLTATDPVNIGSYHFVRSGKMRPNGLKIGSV